MKINPVILSGGSGTRLWPLSREHYPKQLLCLLGNQTMLQQTVARLDGMENIAAPLLVCNEEHRFLIAEQLRQMGKAPADIVLEPIGRNTAPALTLAALALQKHAPEDALMLVMPADHVIQHSRKFHASVAKAVTLAEKGHLVTFGIRPTAPETGYGYIKMGNCNTVAEFVEKPDMETAVKYIKSGDYYWNSGMFMMLASAWIAELQKFHPAMLESCKAAYEQGRRDADFYRVNAQAFGSCQPNSIDYAVMEETDRAAMVALDAGWSDIGAWSSLWEASVRDVDGNVVQGDVYLHDTQDTLLISQHRFLAAVGLNDIIVVETPDAVLVAHKKQAQNVKEIVARLKSEKRSEYQSHRRVYRPWGYYEGIDAGPRFQVKRLMVKPGAALSLQMHHHRAEHWIVVKGTARVTTGEEVFMLTENQSTYIPLGTTHRLENPGNIPLEIIEVQSGSYLGEDDIVRFNDKYNRTK
jgi:mannose-1-phosphate guanylyltransferase / mannose-6-phosphate isomerase